MDPFNFNELPEVVRLLFEKLEQVESLVINLQPKNEEENELMNVQEAAQFLKISVASLYTRVSRNEIPVSKPGKRLYFNRTELIDWIRGGRKKTLTEIPIKAISDMRRHNAYKPHKLDEY
ncbi:DNA-binding protein [Mucilaginibacter conchicola]|uniref:DNA-binding protein n=1 Tax=Mucilaginibacter conchicola TaxID=2303333 RepID=A0A372NRU0_9SPHI|nr:helix-turn-helix domain-containing protein [Mucilaginibacter conchicola]RFZ91065.1 DNA-binding protein [Mucilaginibacter conchicola]